jgi:hypothetical protein
MRENSVTLGWWIALRCKPMLPATVALAPSLGSHPRPIDRILFSIVSPFGLDNYRRFAYNYYRLLDRSHNCELIYSCHLYLSETIVHLSDTGEWS